MSFRLGVLVNPYAGIGGSVALKGSDGEAIRDQALALGAQLKAPERMSIALKPLVNQPLEVFTWGGLMGESACLAAGVEARVLGEATQEPSTAVDTHRAAQVLVDEGIDLLLFAGGDGTARDLCQVIDSTTPVLGVPAGVKIHSGVYALTPAAAGELARDLVRGELVSLDLGEVRDIDETVFRQGRVSARYYGELSVPAEHRYVQSVKESGREVEALVLDDLAADFIEQMDPDMLYVMGSGSTVAHIMGELGLENSLLGVDLVLDGELIAKDCTAAQLLQYTEERAFKLVVTLIGGQGHLIGRGNQQLSPALLERCSFDDFYVVATRAKLKALNGRPLVIDSGKPELDSRLTGLIPIHTGYRDAVLYRVGL